MRTRNVENSAMLDDQNYHLGVQKHRPGGTTMLPIDKPKSVFKLEKSEKSKNSTKKSTMKPDLVAARSFDTEFSRTSR